jgi:hypothetical protein
MAPAQKNTKKAAAAAAIAALMLATSGQGAAAAAQPAGRWPDADEGCPSKVFVALSAKSNPGGWVTGNPSITGSATVINAERFSIPVQSVQVMIVPANSAVSPVFANCRGLAGGRVPASPNAWDEGRASCRFDAPLPSKGPSTGARNWQQARAVVTLQNGAKCYSEMTSVFQDSSLESDVARGVTNLVIDSIFGGSGSGSGSGSAGSAGSAGPSTSGSGGRLGGASRPVGKGNRKMLALVNSVVSANDMPATNPLINNSARRKMLSAEDDQAIATAGGADGVILVGADETADFAADDIAIVDGRRHMLAAKTAAVGAQVEGRRHMLAAALPSNAPLQAVRVVRG